MKKNKKHIADEVQNVRDYNRKLSLFEFGEEVARAEGLKGLYYCVNPDYCSPDKTAIYYANITRSKDQTKWLYLFIPRSRNGVKYFSITRRRTDINTNPIISFDIPEGVTLNNFNFDHGRTSLGNNIRIKTKQR